MAGAHLSVLAFVFYLIFQIVIVFAFSFPVFLYHSLKNMLISKEKNLKGKIVLITGSARGLGKALAREFAKQGCKVICVDINKALNDQTVEGINEETEKPDAAIAMTCDVGDFDSVRRLRAEIEEKFDKIDILVNNAGIVYARATSAEKEASMTRRVINVNLLSCFWLVQNFLPKMRENNEGHIVFINSISSLIPLGDATAYTSTKCGVLGLTDALLDEFSRTTRCSNIKISSVHPFFVRTEGLTTLNVAPRHIMMEARTAAFLIVRGIRREYKKFAVPGDELVFWILSLAKILPHEVYQTLINKLYKKVLNEDVKFESD